MSYGSDSQFASGSGSAAEVGVAKNGRRTPKQDRAQATVDAVIEAAARILVEDGYARLSTNKVAQRAGVSVGTLYQYFPNKESIVEALVHRIADERLGAFASALSEVAVADLPMREAVTRLLDATLATMRVRPALSRRLFHEAPRGGRMDLEHEWQRRSVDLVRAVLYPRRDQVRGGDVELMSHVLVTGAFAVLQDAMAWRPELLEGTALRDELVELAVRYLGPQSSAPSSPSP